MRAKLSAEVRCRVRPEQKRHIGQLAELKDLQPQDILREAIRDYLAANPLDGIEASDPTENTEGAASNMLAMAAPLLALLGFAPILLSGVSLI